MGMNWTAPKISSHKVRDGNTPLVMLTAYDAPGAKMVTEAGADIILVGDSLGMVVLGYDDTLKVTIDDMAHHTAAVVRAEPDAFVVADLPWLSYHISPEETVKNAAQLIRAGAKAVKLEGGYDRIPMIEAICKAEIPVMGHLGLTPQSILSLGGYKIQGKTTNAALTISNEAKESIINKIKSKFGDKFVYSRDFQNKNKSAQEAHEAVRPTKIDVEEITSDFDQQRLYKLIWKRTISSQMADAEIEKTIVKIQSDKYDYKFTSTGEVIIFEGFLKVYLEGTDDESEEEKAVLPKITEGEKLELDKITSKEMFSRPPSRYTEASLVKKMEELGIGRPATYATTISTIQKRGYIEKGSNEGSERDYKLFEFSNNEAPLLGSRNKINSVGQSFARSQA